MNVKTRARLFSSTKKPLTHLKRLNSLGWSQSASLVPVQSQIVSASPSSSELLVSVGSGFENRSSASSWAERAAEIVTHTVLPAPGSAAMLIEYLSIVGTDTDPPSRTEVPEPVSLMTTRPRSGVARL